MATRPIHVVADAASALCGTDAVAQVMPMAPTRQRAAIRRFVFNSPQLIWRVEHNVGTDAFLHVLRDSAGQLLYAPVDIVDRNTFQVRLSSATTGYVDAVFGTL